MATSSNPHQAPVDRKVGRGFFRGRRVPAAEYVGCPGRLAINPVTIRVTGLIASRRQRLPGKLAAIHGGKFTWKPLPVQHSLQPPSTSAA